ncbi:alpha/beta fold hydrolase [Sphaerotilaceae bacterium SBD11-9]
MTQTIQVDGVDLHLEGDGPQTVVMIHGWPDTWRLWDAQVAALAPTHRCVRFTVPGFDAATRRRGLPLDDMVAFFARVVDAVSPTRPVVLMLHDWGCVFGLQYALRHAHRVARVVAVDVGDSGSPAVAESQTPAQRRRVMAYQLKLALAWYIGGGLGDRMTRRMARLQRAPSEAEAICATMNFPYAMRWMGALGGLRHALPARPAWPTLFIWGTRKTMMFHSPQWIAALQARPDCRIVGIDAGHWMMVTRAKEFNAAVLAWLGAPPSA